MASVRQRVLTGTSLAVGVALLFLADRHAAPGVVPWIVGTALLIGCVRELATMGTIGGRALFGMLTVPVVGLSALVFWMLVVARGPVGWGVTSELSCVYGVCALLALCGVGGLRGVAGAPPPSIGWARAWGLSLWIVPPFAILSLFERDHGTRGLVVLIVLSKIGDVFGYFVGRSIGRRHPFPHVSPNKTVAGCVASLVSATLAGGLLGKAGLMGGRPVAVAGLLAGLVLNLASQGGDLLESAMKRRSGVKDSGELFGASGGVLDVVDSLLLSIPTAALVWPWLFSD